MRRSVAIFEVCQCELACLRPLYLSSAITAALAGTLQVPNNSNLSEIRKGDL